MPIYKYQCYKCGLEFEEIRKASLRESCPCQNCGEPADKKVSSGNFNFKHNPTGPVPQNTGVSSIDHNFDRVIGRDAAQKWEGIEERRSRKLSFIEEERRKGRAVDMSQISATPEGGFRTLSNAEISEVNANRQAVEAYNKDLQEKHKKQPLKDILK